MTRTTWEYKVFRVKRNKLRLHLESSDLVDDEMAARPGAPLAHEEPEPTLEAALARLGAEGWELVSFETMTDPTPCAIGILKRPLAGGPQERRSASSRAS